MPTGLRGTGLLASGRLERWAVLRGGCSVGHGVIARRDSAILEMVAGDNDRFPPIKFRNGEIARLAAVGVRRALFVDDIFVLLMLFVIQCTMERKLISQVFKQLK